VPLVNRFIIYGVKSIVSSIQCMGERYHAVMYDFGCQMSLQNHTAVTKNAFQKHTHLSYHQKTLKIFTSEFI